MIAVLSLRFWYVQNAMTIVQCRLAADLSCSACLSHVAAKREEKIRVVGLAGFGEQNCPGGPRSLKYLLMKLRNVMINKLIMLLLFVPSSYAMEKKTGTDAAIYKTKGFLIRLGYTPLHLAAQAGDMEALIALLRGSGNVLAETVNALAENGFSPLHCAAEYGHVEAIESIKCGSFY